MLTSPPRPGVRAPLPEVIERTLERVDAILQDFSQEVIDLTCQLIAAPSQNPPGDESAPAAVAERFIHAQNLPVARVVAREPHRPNLLLTIEGHLPGPHLGICGHLDTKPAGDAIELWQSDPLTPTVVGERLYGLGSTDMKGAIAAMLCAAVGLHATRDRLQGNVTFILSADEEYGSRFGAHYLVQCGALESIDAMILGEPSGLHKDWDALRTVSRGCSCFSVQLRGMQMHSSISDTFSAVSAVEAMSRVMTEFRRAFKPRYPDHPLCPTGPTINIGVKAQGGVGYGVVAGFAEFENDVRLVPGMTREIFVEDVQSALDACQGVLGGAELTLDIDSEIAWSDATEIDASHPAVEASLMAGERILGARMPLAYFPGGTDAIAFQAAAGIPTIAAFGPGQLPLAHAPNEWVSISSVQQAMRMYALAAHLYGNLAG